MKALMLATNWSNKQLKQIPDKVLKQPQRGTRELTANMKR